MFDKAFQPQPAGVFGDIDACQVIENTGGAPSLIIRTDSAWRVRLQFHINGPLALGLAGQWEVRSFVESIGNGFEGQVGSVIVPLGAGVFVPADRKNYTAEVAVPAGTVPAGAYKLVTTVTYRQPDGTLGPLAGYCEERMLQFFQSNP